MPPLAVLIPAIISGVVGGTELGMNVAGVGQPSPGDAAKQQQKLMDEQQKKQQQDEAQARQKMILSNMANAQDQVGGATGNTGLVNLASIISGLPGEATSGPGRGALASYLGTSQPQDQNLVQQTFGLSGSMGA